MSLPLGTFPRGHRWSPDVVVYVVCLLLAAGLILWTAVL
jgi:hypothetical protein